MSIPILGREPALWIAFLSAAVMALAGFGIPWLDAGQSTAIVAGIAAVLIALTTRPIGPGLFVSAFSAGAAVFAEYGLPLSEAQVTAIGVVIMMGFALVGVRPQVTPAADPKPLP